MPASHGPRRSLRTATRLASACLASCCVSLSASGCGAFDRALGQRWVVVDFQSGTTVPAMLRARAACSHISNVLPEDHRTARRRARLDGQVQYTISKASDAQVSLLETCLQHFPFVVGVTPEDTSNGQ